MAGVARVACAALIALGAAVVGVASARAAVSVSDAYGNRIDYGANGYQHLAGLGLLLVRDAQGRITRATDPAGKFLAYGYNAAGELATVTDRSGKVTRAQLQELLDAHQRIGIAWDNIDAVGVQADIAKRCKQLAAVKMRADTWGLWPGTAVPVFGTGLLPVGGDGDPVICFDLAPGEGGTVGQIVEVSFEEASCKVIAHSLFDLIAQGLSELKRLKSK